MISDFFLLLLKHSYKELKYKLFGFIFFYIIYAIIEIQLFSNIISKLINNLKNQKQNKNDLYSILKEFLFFIILYIIFLNIYKYFQINLLLYIKKTVRLFLFDFVLNTNEKKYIEKNYVKYSSLINRVTEKLFWSINNFVIWILPTIVTIIIVSIMLFYYDKYVFVFFLLINLFIITVFVLKFGDYNKKSTDFEKAIVDIESKQVETFSNFDKIIFRGFSSFETNIFEKMHDKVINFGKKYYYTMLTSEFLNTTLINLSIYLIILYFIFKKNSKNIVFVITLLLIYRSKIESCIIRLSDIMEIISKLTLVNKNFIDLVDNYSKDQYIDNNIRCDRIILKNIYFKYPNTSNYIFENLNLDLDFNKNKIIGLYGHSGSGKSSLCKLLIKIYEIENGNILINNKNIKNINSKSLKRKITYINQNNKLFDNNVKYNIKYGCTSEVNCDKYLDEILKYDNLINVFHKKSNQEIMKINTGFLGEKISGGQRQVINVINGMIYPSELLILDEPTSNLDKETKNNIIKIIKIFKKHKKGIIIITHDKDLIPLFDRIIDMDKIKLENKIKNL